MAQPQKSPGVAAVLSFLITGLGQIYNGQIGKGIFLLILAGIAAAVLLHFWNIASVNALFGESGSEVFVCLGAGLALVALWLGSIIDAYRNAEAFNKRRGFL
jgi:membrane-bound metal-dependent hydrolase YbcI (DUF457 family)